MVAPDDPELVTNIHAQRDLLNRSSYDPRFKMSKRHFWPHLNFSTVLEEPNLVVQTINGGKFGPELKSANVEIHIDDDPGVIVEAYEDTDDEGVGTGSAKLNIAVYIQREDFELLFDELWSIDTKRTVRVVIGAVCYQSPGERSFAQWGQHRRISMILGERFQGEIRSVGIGRPVAAGPVHPNKDAENWVIANTSRISASSEKQIELQRSLLASATHSAKAINEIRWLVLVGLFALALWNGKGLF